MEKEKLYDSWANRNPEWESRYEESILRTFCDYGRGANQFIDVRGKIFGAAYEILIIAFFIGLYYDQRKPLTTDASRKKTLGQPIKFWGNLDSKPGRIAYPKLRNYIFAALVARTDLDFLALDKGEMTLRQAVDKLMTTMEEYINWGLDFMTEKMEENPNCFFKETAFLRVFQEIIAAKEPVSESGDDDMPEPLD